MDTHREDDSLDPQDDSESKPVDPEDADDAGVLGGSGGPAAIIYGDEDDSKADEHGDRLTRGPEESL